jgi:hypothetical protein
MYGLRQHCCSSLPRLPPRQEEKRREEERKEQERQEKYKLALQREEARKLVGAGRGRLPASTSPVPRAATAALCLALGGWHLLATRC